MANAIKEQFGPAERQKVYLLLLFASLALLFFAMWQARPVLVKVSDPWGLMDYLTPAYWAGLGLLMAASVAAFLDPQMKSQVIHILLLLGLGLFLLGIVVFLYEVTRNPDVYYPNTEAYRVVQDGSFDINAMPPSAYYSWPSVTLSNGGIILVSGMKGDFIQDFVKYMPLFWMFFLVLTAYGVGKRLRLEPRFVFLVAFLAVASWWELNSYHNHSWGPLLYLLLFMMCIEPRQSTGEIVSIILVFVALLITHATSSFMFFASFMLVVIYRRDFKLVALFSALFLAWYVYQAWPTASLGINQALSGPFWQLQAVASAERYSVPSVGARAVARYSQLGYLGMYVAIVGVCTLLFLLKKLPKKHNKLFVACFLWNVGMLGLMATGISPELHRFYLFGLVPTGVMIAICAGPVNRVAGSAALVLVMLIVVALRLPAEYSLEAAWIQIPPSEIAVSRYFVYEMKPPPVPNPYYFSVNGSVTKILQGFDPRVTASSPLHITTLPSWPDVDFRNIDNWVEYVMITRQGVDSEMFSFGRRMYTLWPESPGGKQSYRLYDNGESQIYYNPLSELTRNRPYVPVEEEIP